MLKVTGKIDEALKADITAFFTAKGYTGGEATGEGDEVTLTFAEAVVEPPPTPELDALVEEVKAVNEKIVADVKAVVEKIDSFLSAQPDTDSDAVKSLRDTAEKFRAFITSLTA